MLPPFGSIEGHKWFFPDFQPMRVSEELVCIYLFRQNPVFFTSLHEIWDLPFMSYRRTASGLIWTDKKRGKNRTNEGQNVVQFLCASERITISVVPVCRSYVNNVHWAVWVVLLVQPSGRYWTGKDQDLGRRVCQNYFVIFGQGFTKRCRLSWRQ
jgi:hypothetical protein